MADITLADYTGYIFLELIRAREMADRHSRALAEAYAADPVLKHFSVPRFKVPKMELTVPVLVSGARFQQQVSFKMERDQFEAYVTGRVKEVLGAVRGGVIFRPRLPDVPAVKAAGTRAAAARAPVAGSSVPERIAKFYDDLRANPDPTQTKTLVRDAWAGIVEQALTDAAMVEAYKKQNPADELFTKSLADVQALVDTHTVVDSTRIQSLLINPETNVVKNGSSDTSVFSIRAEMVEEGFFIRSMKDEATGQTTPVVEFD